MNKKNLIKLCIFIILLLWAGKLSKCIAQTDEMLDPLNLQNNTNQKPITKKYQATRAIITSITADKSDNAIIVSGIPELACKLKTQENIVKIRILNSYLHKSISSKYYNWNLKLRNILPGIYKAFVTSTSNDKDVLISIKFEYPVTTSVLQKEPGKITFIFKKVESPDLNNFSNNNQSSKTITPKDIDTLAFSRDDKNHIHKPSGKYLTVEPSSNKLIISNSNTKGEYNSHNKKSYNSKRHTDNRNNTINKNISSNEPNKLKLSPDNQKKMKNIPPDLPLPNPPEISNLPKEPTPGNYGRSPNDFSSDPTVLPPLERPENTENELMNIDDYDDLLRIAISLESENKLDDSLQKYSQAIMINPERYEAYSAKGDVYLKQKKYKLAIENYEKSININNNQVKTLFNIAIAYNKTKQHLKALANLKKVLAIQPQNYEVIYNIANTYYTIKDYANAIDYYRQCILLLKKSKNDMELARVRYNLANTYKAQNDHDNAIKEYKESIKLFKEFADAHYNLAATYVETDNNAKAINEFKEYIKLCSSKEEIERIKKIIEQLKSN